MLTLPSHHANNRPDLTHIEREPREYGSLFTLGFASIVLAVLAIIVCFIQPIALAAVPMSVLALIFGLVDVKITLTDRDSRIGIALIACILSLAAFVMSVDAASTVRRLGDPTQPEPPRPWRDPGSSTETP